MELFPKQNDCTFISSSRTIYSVNKIERLTKMTQQKKMNHIHC